MSSDQDTDSIQEPGKETAMIALSRLFETVFSECRKHRYQ